MYSFLDKSKFFKDIASGLKKKNTIFVNGVYGCIKPLLYSYISSKSQGNIFIVTSSEDIYSLYAELKSLVDIFGMKDREILLYPEDDSIIYHNIKPSKEVSKIRLELYKKSFEKTKKIIVTDINALVEKIPGPEYIKNSTLSLKKGSRLKPEKVAALLSDYMYERNVKVESTYEYSVRGSIIDIFSPDHEYPLRIEFFGDEIESIRMFSLDTYNTTKHIDEVSIMLYNPFDKMKRGHSSVIDYFDPGKTIVITDDTDKVKREIGEKAEKIEMYINNDEIQKNIFSVKSIFKRMTPYKKIKSYSIDKSAAGPRLNSGLNPSFKRNLTAFFDYLYELKSGGYKVFIISDNKGETEHLKEIIGSHDEEESTGYLSRISFLNGDMQKGCVLHDEKVCIISNREIFERYKGKVMGRLKGKNIKPVKHFMELEKDDYIVHAEHGIGIFEGVRTISVDDITGDFILIRYAGDDKLYIPIYNIDLVDKYIGTEKIPSLSKLGTTFWKRTKEDIQRQLKIMAKELMGIYAKREVVKGFAFSPSDDKYSAFEDAFIYQETPDQAKAIEDVKNDMMQVKQMDRLVCGDAGFGKTEVAMRAAFKAVNDGKQVLLLTATTLLAQQHYYSFAERMADYPIKVAMLSRLVSKKAKNEIIEKVKSGEVDILIGTHSVLSKKIDFMDIGIVIIDEEQHFGVKAKESLREKHPKADLLTLSATPIPRTLYFSLSGIRDISIINTPPPNKKSIETYIIEERLAIVKEIILREVLRKGQVFYVHNNIQNIAKVQEVLQKNLPEVKFRIAHGRMKKTQLEKIMIDFLNKKFDVLITTTIIESGLDMPDVNTIIISNAGNFGLSQLYQLRGRVGRRDRQAFAYLMVKDAVMLTDVAKERLKTIESYIDPGAGFKIAMKDLELRGTGNLVGTKQHGNMEKIGFEMYCRMLEDAVAELEGKEAEKAAETKIMVDFKAHIPENYIWDTGEKIRIYRKMFMSDDITEMDETGAEIKDVWGALPVEVENILFVGKLKIIGKKTGVNEILVKGERIVLMWDENKEFKNSKVQRFKEKGGIIEHGKVEITMKNRNKAAKALWELVV